ncbi:MAG: hypothetical protein J0I41_21295 [Filimonas sp.]|nr:hypothetical protein [Filimonas sp.]
MKKLRSLLFLFFLTMVAGYGYAQKVTYAEPDKDDGRSLNFEIIGKMKDHYVIYKNYRDFHFISLYNDDMKMTEKVRLEFMPDKVINTDFLAMKDSFYIFYQYQRKSIVYCMAALINADGQPIGKPIELDTTNISYASSKKLYSILISEDKKRIGILKVNAKNDDLHIVTVSFFDRSMQLQDKTKMAILMPEKNDFLTEFTLDNDGDVSFLRAAGTAQNDNITKLALITRSYKTTDIAVNNVDLKSVFMDDVRLKVDNINKHILLTSFYSKTKRGNIDGLYCSLWDKTTSTPIATICNLFGDDFRNEAKGESSMKTAFNDYFLQNILMKKDGGFFIAAESVYTSSRTGANNRWDYMYGSPFMSPYNNYYYYSNPYNYYYPWGRWGSFNQVTRYFADNIAILSFGPSAQIEWADVVKKSQYDDNSDNFIGYGTMTMGSEVHFLFNQLERRDLLLNDQSISADGQVRRNPTLRNLDRGYDFMPRFAKQVSSWQLIVPCEYRNYISFAKIEF